MDIGNMQEKTLDDDRTCNVVPAVMRVYRQTDAVTTILRSPIWGGVKRRSGRDCENAWFSIKMDHIYAVYLKRPPHYFSNNSV